MFGVIDESGYRQFRSCYIEVGKKNGKTIRKIAFDRWGAAQMVQNLENLGFTVVPFGQGFKDMSPPTKDLMRLVLSKQIAHGSKPVLRWMIDNVCIQTDSGSGEAIGVDDAGNIKPSKAKSCERIDGVVAMIMGLARALVLGSAGSDSVYDQRGILFLDV